MTLNKKRLTVLLIAVGAAMGCAGLDPELVRAVMTLTKSVLVVVATTTPHNQALDASNTGDASWHDP